MEKKIDNLGLVVLGLENKDECKITKHVKSEAIKKGYIIICVDKFGVTLKDGDSVDVQKDGVHKIYTKEDGQLYFKPYGKENRVCEYFSNDIIKCK